MIDIKQYSEEILKDYYWNGRNKKECAVQIPDELKKAIKKQIKANVPEWEGPIPHLTLANINGIHNKIMTEDEDGVVFVVAPPGYGKTTQAIMAGKFVNPEIDNEKIIFDMNELKEFLSIAAQELRKEKMAIAAGTIYVSYLKGKSIILDEGVFMMFSGDAMTKDGKLIQKLLSVIRALNLMIVVCATNFRKVNKGVKEDRIIGLIRIARRGVIEFYSKKRIRRIKILENTIYWGRPNFVERSGKLKKDSTLWKNYEVKKANFLVDAAEDDKPKRSKKGRPKGS